MAHIEQLEPLLASSISGTEAIALVHAYWPPRWKNLLCGAFQRTTILVPWLLCLKSSSAIHQILLDDRGLHFQKAELCWSGSTQQAGDILSSCPEKRNASWTDVSRSDGLGFLSPFLQSKNRKYSSKIKYLPREMKTREIRRVR